MRIDARIVIIGLGLSIVSCSSETTESDSGIVVVTSLENDDEEYDSGNSIRYLDQYSGQSDSAISDDSETVRLVDSGYEVDSDSFQTEDGDSRVHDYDASQDVENTKRDAETRPDTSITVDAGVPDAEIDFGIEDSGYIEDDADVEDSGQVDSGIEDSGQVDSGIEDSGPIDAGPQECEHPGNWVYVCSNSLDCIPPISWTIIDYESVWCDPTEDSMPGLGPNTHIFLEGYDEDGYRDTLCNGGYDATYIQWRNRTGPGYCIKVEVEGNRKVYAGISRCDEWDRGKSCLIVDERTDFRILMKKDTQPGWLHLTAVNNGYTKCPLTCE